MMKRIISFAAIFLVNIALSPVVYSDVCANRCVKDLCVKLECERESVDAFKGKLIFIKGAKPNHEYVISLNGKVGHKSNDLLKEACEVYKPTGEGFCNLPRVSTKPDGSLEVEVNTNLPKGNYNVKLLIKDPSTPGWIVVWNEDDVKFEVKDKAQQVQQVPAKVQQVIDTHKIFMNAIEFKGLTTTDKLAPPGVNPATLSKGYGFKAPGEIDKNAPQQWEVASYTFTPGFITVQQGDKVEITVFIVNGDQHEAAVLAPDGQVVVPIATWQRGKEYQVSFMAEKAGTYRLSCFTHAPTMTTSILVLPR